MKRPHLEGAIGLWAFLSALTGGLIPGAVAHGSDTVLVIDQAETAGISGFRAMWDTPIVLAPDGTTEMVDTGQFGAAVSAIWSTEKRKQAEPGALAFDGVHRSLLVRFPGAAAAIAGRLAGGFVIEKVELQLPFKGTELWPEGYDRPAGMSFLGNQWASSTPRWHAVAWALRQPWQADGDQGPTFNAWRNGAGYWAKYGAQDTEHDRFPKSFGPTEVSRESPEGRMDVTAVLADAAFGASLADRLRTLEQCGFLVRKWETYDAALWKGGYEWQTARGPQGILIEAPRLIVTFAKGKFPQIDKTAITFDREAYLTQLRQQGRLGKPTALLPANNDAELRALADRLGFRRPPWMPEWQWQHVQELASLGGGEDFPTTTESYLRWLDEQLARAPRSWAGFDAANLTTSYFRNLEALPEPVRDHWRLYWDAWLMPDRDISELVQGYVGGEAAQAYYQRTRDWRGNFSVYRTYCRDMGTMNFNHWAAAGTLLGGSIVDSKRLLADGRHGLEHWPLRTWCWYDGSTQESIDHYYFAHSLAAQKAFADWGPERIDRLMGQSILAKSVEELASAWHPGLRRFVASSTRTGIAYPLAIQDGLHAIMHSVSPAGGYTDKGRDTVSGPNVEAMPTIGRDYRPGDVAWQTLSGPWAPAWMAVIADDKRLPYEMTVNYMMWGGYRATPLWRRSYLGKTYGLASQDVSSGNETVPVMAQWRRAEATASSMTDLGTLLVRPGVNRTELLDSLFHGTTRRNPNGSVGTQGSTMATLHDRNRMIVLASPTKRLEYQGGRPVPEEIESLQVTAGIMRFTDEPLEILVDDAPIKTLPHRFKYGGRIAIRDGATYIGLIPIPAADLERTIDCEIIDDGVMTEMQGGGKAREAVRINAYMMGLLEPVKRAAVKEEEWQRIDLGWGGYVIELGDASEYGDFAAFRRHLGTAALETRWEPEAKTLHVSYRSADRLLELGYCTDYAGGWGKHVRTDRCFPYRRVNGEWPYLAAGINRDTSATVQGTSGRLEKNGAILETGEGNMGYLVSVPAKDVVVAWNPLPDLVPLTLHLPPRGAADKQAGGTLTVDGRVGICQIVCDTRDHGIVIEHAVHPRDADRYDVATGLFVAGGAGVKSAIVNGESVNPIEVTVDGQRGVAIPLDKRFDRDRFVERHTAARRAASQSVDLRETLIQDWQIVGPFPNPDMKGFDTPFPPEVGEIDMAATYEGINGGKVAWQRILPAGQPPLGAGGVVDLAARLKPNAAATAYACTRVVSDRDRQVTLLTGSDDSISAWVNGKKVLANKAYRGVGLDSDRVQINLRKGENTLLIKIDNAGGGWGFVARLADEWGVPLTEGIQYGFGAE